MTWSFLNNRGALFKDWCKYTSECVGMNFIHYNHSIYICLTDALMLAVNSEKFINKVVQTYASQQKHECFLPVARSAMAVKKELCVNHGWAGFLYCWYSNEHSVMSILTHKMSEGWQAFHQVMSVSGLCQTGVASQRIASPAGGK